MEYNIVTNYKINQFLKNNSKYYKVNLGQSLTFEDRSGERVLNKKDPFSFVYNTFYKAQIMRQGSIGDITFYTDNDIREDVLALYIDNEEFVHQYDERFIKEKGVDAFLGNVLKISKEEFEAISKQKSDEENITKTGNSEKVLQNPGSVTYADLKAYMEEKNAQRLKN
jgi:hypothetical protein